MPSTFFGLNIGLSGLYAYQAALNTTGHNISNVETPGYTRQKVTQQAANPLSVSNSYGMVGTGVDATGIVQIRDKYYDVKYWNNNAIAGEYTEKYHYMTQFENYFNDLTLKGFNSTFNSFFDSLQEISKNTAGEPARKQASTIAGSLTDYFNQLSNQMKEVQEDANFEVKNQVDRINSIAEQIAAITRQINTIELGNENANDLRDQRALLVDELSSIASVKVEEHTVGLAEVGVTNYTVMIDGQTLLDSDHVNKLNLITREKKHNMNDIEGLYDIRWSSGADFNIHSQSLGGTLKALIEVRDGNNDDNFTGTGSSEAGKNAVGDNKLVVNNSNINSVNKLNIPPEGVIKVGNYEYEYTGFTATKNANGSYSYEFDLKTGLKEAAAGNSVSVGKSINYKGVPYYMSKLNEFVRTFSSEFNGLHNKGVDLEGHRGLDYFNIVDPVTGKNPPAGLAEEGTIFTFNSRDAGYYLMTAGNISITEEIAKHPEKFAATDDLEAGVENKNILDQMLKLNTKAGMFKQGTPSEFFQTLFDEIGVDTDKAKDFAASQVNIMSSITNQRLSVSGVDKEEEAMDLIKFKNAYDLSAKVVSVMNEILDKLINQMGV